MSVLGSIHPSRHTDFSGRFSNALTSQIEAQKTKLLLGKRKSIVTLNSSLSFRHLIFTISTHRDTKVCAMKISESQSKLCPETNNDKHPSAVDRVESSDLKTTESSFSLLFRIIFLPISELFKRRCIPYGIY